MPSSQADLDELEALLDELNRLTEDVDGDYVPLLSGVDGFLTQLVISSEHVPQEEWLEALLMGAGHLLPDVPAERLNELLLARKAEIAGQFLQGQRALEPIYEVDRRHNEVLWEFWIAGFERAMELRHRPWMALIDSDDGALAQAAAELDLLIGIASGALKSSNRAKVNAEAPDRIPFLAEVVYRRQRGLPISPDAEPPRSVQATTTGRNKPCPCGSGKKYKRCCGQ